MAQIWVRRQDDLTQEIPLKCASLYWKDMYDNRTQAQYRLLGQHIPNQTDQYHSLSFVVGSPNFTIEGEKWTVLGEDIATADTLTDYPMMDQDIEKVSSYGTGNYYSVQWKDSAFTPMTVGVKPDDWDSMYFCKYFVKTDFGSGWTGYQYQALRRSATWSPTTQYYKSNKTYTMQYTVQGSGIIDFTFGARTILGGGGYYAGNGSKVWSMPKDLNFLCSYYEEPPANMGLPGLTSIESVDSGTVFSVSNNTTYKGPYCYAVPVAFNIPGGTVIGTGQSGTYEVPQNRQYYGIMFVRQNTFGIVDRISVQAIESLAWAAPTHPHQDYGEDTPAYGGKGKAPVGKDNPRQTITKAKQGGILTDITSGAGIVIYKMTETEFSNFLKAFTDKSLKGWAQQSSSGTLNFQNIFSQLSTFMSKDSNNILFIKTSPVDFPSTGTKTISKLMVGTSPVSSGYENNLTAKVVTQWYKEGHNSLAFAGTELGKFTYANDFTDLEPYTSAEIYFPTASSMSVLPSYLSNCTMQIDYGFNLLDSSATYTTTIYTNLFEDSLGGTVQLASTGYCCRDADVLVADREIKEAVQSLSPLVAKGIATIATGGMTAPALVTTALGAATTAVESTQPTMTCNVPTSGSTSPYNDCITGGRRSIVLTINKARRFSQGEESASAGRADIMGYYSNFYIEQISTKLTDGDFFSIQEIKMNLASGMTKAEYDKIIALLHEGVWL